MKGLYIPFYFCSDLVGGTEVYVGAVVRYLKSEYPKNRGGTKRT